ncbi:ATP-grasp fold amidoligase family protein [Sphingomonas sp. Leaf21]|uniref:ATP-grasp fold amidoligase family protein n=1 Tax=Sphingomonas sp. Leaf21 TaxID=2876550 RepID=UPI001E3BC11F|nr:ATP-grasp fold amidoligase family protein [Sphingomonas sp. Leaf21]
MTAAIASGEPVIVGTEPGQTEQRPLDPWLEPASLATFIRVHLSYLWRHARILSLRRPQRFTELVQLRKLVDRDRRMPGLIDKLAVKQMVADRLGAQWVTPTLWSGMTLPDRPPCAAPFVLKSRHGCRQIRIVRDDGEDWQAIRRASARWVRRPYGRWLDEWGYRSVPRGLLIEPFIGDGQLPIDYKLYVFHGRVAAIQVHLERETAHRWALYDRSWRRLSATRFDRDPPQPAALAEMIAGAETLAAGFDFIRIDLYDIDGTPRFGEMTFYPGSGLDPFDPSDLDRWLGRLWLARGQIERGPMP